MKRNINIELIRIIACFIVISLHITQTYIINNNLDKSLLLIRCLFIDGVTLFWFIMGYFLFKNKTFIDNLKRTIKKIVIPSIFIIIFTQIFYNWLISATSFIVCIKNFSINVKGILSCLLFFDVSKIDGAAHLWYIFEYVKVILWIPVLSLFCNKSKKSSKIRRYIIITGIIYMLLNSLQMLLNGVIQYSPFMIGTSAIIQVLIGYELSIYEEENFVNSKRKNMKLGIILYSLSIGVRFLLQLLLYNKFNNPEYFLHTGRIINLTSALGIFLFFKSIQINTKLNNIIIFISSNTFNIYLIHYALITKLDSIGFKKIILNMFSKNLIGEVFFNFIYTILIFITCLFISIIMKNLIKVVKSSFYYSFKKCSKVEIN